MMIALFGRFNGIIDMFFDTRLHFLQYQFYPALCHDDDDDDDGDYNDNNNNNNNK